MWVISYAGGSLSHLKNGTKNSNGKKIARKVGNKVIGFARSFNQPTMAMAA